MELRYFLAFLHTVQLADHHVFLQVLGARFCRTLLAVNRVVLIEVISKDYEPISVDRF